MNDDNIEEEIRKCLEAEAQAAEPDWEWWHKVFLNLGRQKAQSFWSRFVPKTRLAWVLVPLVALLLGGTVYGATTGVEKLFEGNAASIEKKGLVQNLNLSQTIDGITVTLEQAYADSNVGLVGYSTSLADDHAIPIMATLTTEDGQPLDGMMGISEVQDNTGGLSNFNSATFFAFDASTITGSPSEISLILDVNSAWFENIDNTKKREQEPIGPFVFNFNLTFHPAEVVNINQTIEASGMPITLEKAVISPWGTVVDLKYYAPFDAVSSIDSGPIISLVIPDSGTKDETGGGVGVNGASIRAYFEGDYTGKSGEWTLKLNNLKLASGQTVGPWVFNFNIP
jgi:hypothetical protein